MSLETPVGRDGESALGDLIEDRWVGSPVDAVIESNVRDETADILKTLSPKEEKVIRLRSASAANGSTRSKRSARNSTSRASGSGKLKPRRCGNCVARNEHVICGRCWLPGRSDSSSRPDHAHGRGGSRAPIRRPDRGWCGWPP